MRPYALQVRAAAPLRAELKATRDRFELFALMRRVGVAEQEGVIDEGGSDSLQKLYLARLDMFCGRLRGVEEVRRLTKRRREQRRGMAA